MRTTKQTAKGWTVTEDGYNDKIKAMIAGHKTYKYYFPGTTRPDESEINAMHEYRDASQSDRARYIKAPRIGAQILSSDIVR
jgi:hypothetical protein